MDFPGGSVVKKPPIKQKMWVQSLSQEDSLEEEMAIHTRILTKRIPCTDHGVEELETTE